MCVREPSTWDLECRQCDGGVYGLEAGLQALDCLLVVAQAAAGARSYLS